MQQQFLVGVMGMVLGVIGILSGRRSRSSEEDKRRYDLLGLAPSDVRIMRVAFLVVGAAAVCVGFVMVLYSLLAV